MLEEDRLLEVAVDRIGEEELLDEEITLVVLLPIVELACEDVEAGGEGDEEGALELLGTWLEEMLDVDGTGAFELLSVSSMDVVSSRIEELEALLAGVATTYVPFTDPPAIVSCLARRLVA